MAVGDEMNALGSAVLVDALDDPLNSAGAKVMAEAGINAAAIFAGSNLTALSWWSGVVVQYIW